jgi:hypothetical protein
MVFIARRILQQESGVMKRWLIVLALVLAACGGSSGGGDPADAVERYLQAKVSGDGDTVLALLCSEMESAADREANSFTSVADAKIEGMECTRDGDSEVVRCTGKITAVYGTEATEFPLASYRVVEEDGEWKWCGETE